MSTPENFPQAPQGGFDPNQSAANAQHGVQPQSQGFPQAPAPGQFEQNQGFPQAPAHNQPYPGNVGYNQATSLVEPKQHKTSVMLLWVSLALSIIGLIAGFAMLDTLVDDSLRASGEAITEENRATAKSIALAAMIGGSLISIALNVLIIIFWKKGHNWARILLTIFAAFAVFGIIGSIRDMGSDPLGSIISILSTLAFIAATVLAWTRPVSEWVKAKKAAALQSQGF